MPDVLRPLADQLPRRRSIAPTATRRTRRGRRTSSRGEPSVGRLAAARRLRGTSPRIRAVHAGGVSTDDAELIDLLSASKKQRLHNQLQDFRSFLDAVLQDRVQQTRCDYGARTPEPFLSVVDHRAPCCIVNSGEVQVMKGFVRVFPRTTLGRESFIGRSFSPGHTRLCRSVRREVPRSNRAVYERRSCTFHLTSTADATSEAHDLNRRLSSSFGKTPARASCYQIDSRCRSHVPDTKGNPKR